MLGFSMFAERMGFVSTQVTTQNVVSVMGQRWLWQVAGLHWVFLQLYVWPLCGVYAIFSEQDGIFKTWAKMLVYAKKDLYGCEGNWGHAFLQMFVVQQTSPALSRFIPTERELVWVFLSLLENAGSIATECSESVQVSGAGLRAVFQLTGNVGGVNHLWLLLEFSQLPDQRG